MTESSPGSDQPLLSIVIPTWNRARLLEESLEAFGAQASALSGGVRTVEFVVGDNASDDDTAAVVRRLRERHGLRLTYVRHETNIGSVRNLLHVFGLATGRYVMFYGDDDTVPPGGLARIVDTVTSREEPVLVFRGEPVLPEYDFREEETLPLEAAAARLFYYIGNAGRFAVRGDLARRGRQALPPSGWTCWPQTEILFAAMALSGAEQPLRIVPITSAMSERHGTGTVYTSFHISETPILALYRTAVRLRPIVGERVFDAARGFLLDPAWYRPRLREAFMYKTLSDLPADVRAFRRAAAATLRVAVPQASGPVFLFWLVAMAPTPVLRAGLAIWTLLRSGPRYRSVTHERASRYPRERRQAAESTESGAPRVHRARDFES